MFWPSYREKEPWRNETSSLPRRRREARHETPNAADQSASAKRASGVHKWAADQRS